MQRACCWPYPGVVLAAAAVPQDIKDLLCRLLQDARKVVKALLKMVKNPILKLILTIVEEIGDIAQRAFCPPIELEAHCVVRKALIYLSKQ